jgi:hypothetical protein
MVVSSLAGKAADPSILIDVNKLVTAYYTGEPDPSVPGQRVAFGTSGHRGCSLDNSFNEAHILAITLSLPQTAEHRRTALYRFRYPCSFGTGFQKCIGSAGGQWRRRAGRCA